MGVKSAIGLVAVTLFVLLLVSFLRRRSAAPAPARNVVVGGAESENRGKTITVAQIRQRLQSTKAHYQGKELEAFDRTLDQFTTSLKAQYGEEVPVVDAIKLLRQFPLSTGETSTPPQRTEPPPVQPLFAGAVTAENPPDGTDVERTPAGFLLRASFGSIVTGAPFTIFAVLLAVIPLILWGDLIRGVWTDDGSSFWMTSAFLAIWAGAVLYVGWMAALGLFGEIRIAKTGDSGEIFTGIGKAGRTHRFQWSDFYGAGERAVAAISSRKTGYRTVNYIGLNGSPASYKFGSELNEQQQTFVIAFLREHVFGSSAPPASSRPVRDTPMQESSAPKTTGPAATVSLDHIRQTLEKAKSNYHGRDPDGFNRAAGEFIASLRSQYGDQVPVAEALQHLEKFARATGAPIALSF